MRYWFTVTFAVPTKTGEAVELPFSEAIEQFQQIGVTEFRFRFRTYWTDVAGNKYDLFRNEIQVNVSENPNLEDVFDLPTQTA